MPDLSQTPDEQIVTMTIPVDEPQEEIELPDNFPCTLCEAIFESLGAIDQHMRAKHAEESIQSDNIENPQKHEGGRPCSYCESKDRLQTIANDYIFAAITETDEKKKIKIPFTEELALKLSIHRETLLNWTNESNPHCVANHVEFIDTIKTLKTIQAFRLQQRTLGRYNPTGAIFLLKSNHNFMESEKKILAGDRTEPLTIEIIEEDK